MKKLLLSMSILLSMLLTGQQLTGQVLQVKNNKVGVNNSNPTYHMDVTGDVRGNWFRTTGARGLFSQTYGTYLTPTNTNYWSARSDRGFIIRNKANTIKGYLYHNNQSGFGLLDNDGNWAMRVETDNHNSFYVNNAKRMQISANGIVDLLASRDASGTVNSGVLEIANALRLDGNEIITNTNAALYLQHGNNGDLYVDSGTLFVDASANTIRAPKIFDSNTSYYLDPSNISRMLYVHPRVSNSGYVGSTTNRWNHGYFTNIHRVNEHVLSDRRMKEGIKDIDNALDKVLSLSGKKYKYIKEVFATGAESEVESQATNTTSTITPTRTMNTKSEEKYVDHKMPEGTFDAPEPITPEVFVEDEIITFEDAIPSSTDQKEMASLEKAETNRKQKETFGFIAQDVKEIIPELVDYDEENDLYSMSYTAIIPLLVESIKIQQQQIADQQKQIDALKALIKE